MNFFGHAAVATELGKGPEEALGAMLPDLLPMAGLRAPPLGEGALGDGIRLHHRTDAAFHDAADFQALSHAALADLQRRGLARGPARAVAHVGVELLLDGCLATEARYGRGYLAALRAAGVLAVEGRLGLGGPLPWLRFEALRRSLLGRGVSPQHGSPRAVALRLDYALSGRPRLALSPGDLDKVADWAEATLPSVRGVSGRLFSEVVLVTAELSQAREASESRATTA